MLFVCLLVYEKIFSTAAQSFQCGEEVFRECEVSNGCLDAMKELCVGGPLPTGKFSPNVLEFSLMVFGFC